jgi:outer membrane protein assembly factor BamB
MKLATCWLASLALSCVIFSASAEEWSRFRGPNGTGIADAPNVPAKFTEKDYDWNVTLPGGGHSSPVVWGDRIFITCCDDQTALRTVMCLKTTDGSVLWKREFKSHPAHLNPENSYASATPVVDDKYVYICWSTPEEYSLTALDHEGKDVWKCVLGRFASQHGSGISPVVVGDIVLVGNDQDGPHCTIIGVNEECGRQRAGGLLQPFRRDRRNRPEDGQRGLADERYLSLPDGRLAGGDGRQGAGIQRRGKERP